MKISVLYVGSSLLGPLKNAEREINRAHKLKLQIAVHNFGSPLSDLEWERVDKDLAASEIVFVIHVMDGENASRLVKKHSSSTRRLTPRLLSSTACRI
jgi:hypothetical protein